MLVVDTNVISYLYFPTDYTCYSESLLEFDADWVAPKLWRSEFRNVLTLYLRKDVIDLTQAMAIQHQAELLLAGNEFDVNSDKVLSLVSDSSCSAYDCEFVSLAQALHQPLVTNDKKLLKEFPNHAISTKVYIENML